MVCLGLGYSWFFGNRFLLLLLLAFIFSFGFVTLLLASFLSFFLGQAVLSGEAVSEFLSWVCLVVDIGMHEIST